MAAHIKAKIVLTILVCIEEVSLVNETKFLLCQHKLSFVGTRFSDHGGTRIGSNTVAKKGYVRVGKEKINAVKVISKVMNKLS